MENGLAGGGIVASVLVVLGFVYHALNHKRCRVRICGRSVEVAVDVENTTPPELRVRAPT
jgi:hypothetical protein